MTYKRNYKQKQLKMKTYFTIDDLDNIILYLFSNSPLITRKSLSNLSKVFESIDERIYEHEPYLASRVFYIKKILDAKIRRNINDKVILMNIPKSDFYGDSIENSILPFIEENMDSLQDGDINYINHFVAKILKYNYLLMYKEDLADSIERLELGEYGDLDKINDDMYGICQTLMKHMRETKIQSEKFGEFEMTEDSINTVLADTLEELKSPSNRLETGIQFLDRMTGGGLTFKFSTLIKNTLIA